MKGSIRTLTVLICLVVGSRAFAQIPNPGFETWSGGAPTGWITTNSPGVDTVIRQTTDAHSGTYAVEGLATTVVGGAVVAPMLRVVMPWTTEPTTFSGYYKYSPVSGDTLLLAVVFAKQSTAIGAGTLRLVTSTSSYTQFSIPINYFKAGPPDSAAIVIGIIPASGSSSVHAGSMFEIDDLSLSGVAAVARVVGGNPQSYVLGQNFPNPFNPSTTIAFSVPVRSFVSIVVCDILGREVATLVNSEKSEGSYSVRFDASHLPSGMYFYTLRAGDMSQTKKLVLLK